MEHAETMEDTILYELLVYSEWGPDQETGVRIPSYIKFCMISKFLLE